MAESKIEWTERSDWNPLRGCTRMSQGCVHCYAEAIAARFSDPGQAFHGFATRTAGGGRWTGKVEIVRDRLLLPLGWRKPALIFGSSTSDLFHEALPIADIASIFAVAVAGYHLRGHRTQFLTKRAARMRELLASEGFWEIVNAEASWHVIERVDPLNRRSDDARATLDDYGPSDPAPGVWLGVSVEDQATANERVPHLLATPAALRFLSCEPLLRSVDLETAWAGENALNSECWGDCAWCKNGHPPLYNCASGRQTDAEAIKGRSGIDWVIAGGESGPGARPMHVRWARDLRDQCLVAGVPFLFKQWGEWLPGVQYTPELAARDTDHQFSRFEVLDWEEHGDSLEPDSYSTVPGDEMGGMSGFEVYRVGKKAAGRMLDGVQHDGMPS